MYIDVEMRGGGLEEGCPADLGTGQPYPGTGIVPAL